MDPFSLAWLVWLVIWIAAWRWSKRPQRHEGLGSGLLHALPFMVAVLLIGPSFRGQPWMQRQVVDYAWSFYYLGLILTVSGLAFAVWARFYLGRNWSASVQVKSEHELVRRGPYRFVRHPIYTGILAAFLGSALAQDQWRSVLALVFIVIGLIYKLRVEERFMTETFGAAYDDYRKHTRALVPFLY